MASPQAPTHFRLLELPAELRNRIYHFALRQDPLKTVDLLSAHEHLPRTSLLGLCRQIYVKTNGLLRHARQRYWSSTRFVIHARPSNDTEAMQRHDAVLSRCSRLRTAPIQHLDMAFPNGADRILTLQFSIVEYNDLRVISINEEGKVSEGFGNKTYGAWLQKRSTEANVQLVSDGDKKALNAHGICQVMFHSLASNIEGSLMIW